MLNSLMSFFKEAEEVPQVETHWISESGIIDVFVMLGPKPHDVFQEYASFTGTTALPPVSIVEYIAWRLNTALPILGCKTLSILRMTLTKENKRAKKLTIRFHRILHRDKPNSIFFLDDKITSAASGCTNNGWLCYDVRSKEVKKVLRSKKVKSGQFLHRD